MKADFDIKHEFVDFIPPKRQENTIYVSMEYATAVHSCFCGCGSKVVTPISPTGWRLAFDGDTISLSPSIGSWGLPCRSNYVINRDRVRWAGDMSPEDIAKGRLRDRIARNSYFQASEVETDVVEPKKQPEDATPVGFWASLRAVFKR